MTRSIVERSSSARFSPTSFYRIYLGSTGRVEPYGPIDSRPPHRYRTPEPCLDRATNGTFVFLQSYLSANGYFHSRKPNNAKLRMMMIMMISRLLWQTPLTSRTISFPHSSGTTPHLDSRRSAPCELVKLSSSSNWSWSVPPRWYRSARESPALGWRETRSVVRGGRGANHAGC